jgi:CubicO group peptidase (beta-lactamase class C family)
MSTVSQLTQAPFGTAAAITAVRGNLVVTAVDGTLWDTGPMVNDDTRFNVASVSKLLTAARVISLAHVGKLGLDDPLTAHLPGVKLIGDGNVDDSGLVTIRHLLQHRSGLPHQPRDIPEKVGEDRTAPDLLQKLTASWEIQLAGPLGQYRYSNLAYALLGAIIEQEGGCTFADCMETYFKELEMPRSTFWPATLDDNTAHGRVVVQGSVEFNPPTWYGNRYAIPYTGLWTTMPEFAKFGTLLSASSKDSASPLFAMTVGDGHGLGPIHGERLGAPSLEHDGSTPGFCAAFVVIPVMDIVVTLATNGGNEASSEVTAFTQIVNGAVEAVPEP